MSGLAPTITDYIDIRDGNRLFYGEWPGGGPPLVFAHGLTSSHRNIGAVARGLDGAIQVVAPDLLGRGNSSSPPAGSYGMEAHGRDVLALMDALDIDQAIIGGHSMGAYVATAAVDMAPHRALGLILLDGGVYVAPPGLDPATIDTDALMEQILGPVVTRMEKTFDSVEDYTELWKGMPYFGDDWGPIIEDYLLYDLGRRGSGYGSKCSEVAAREDYRDLLVNPESFERLRRVSCPVLAVGAEFGMQEGEPLVLSDSPHVEVLRATLADVEFVRIPGTTHHTVTLSDHGAAATTEAIRKFATRVTS